LPSQRAEDHEHREQLKAAKGLLLKNKVPISMHGRSEKTHAMIQESPTHRMLIAFMGVSPPSDPERSYPELMQHWVNPIDWQIWSSTVGQKWRILHHHFPGSRDVSLEESSWRNEKKVPPEDRFADLLRTRCPFWNISPAKLSQHVILQKIVVAGLYDPGNSIYKIRSSKISVPRSLEINTR